MEDRKLNELSDEKLDQVVGGSGFDDDDDDYRHTATIDRMTIADQNDLRYLCYTRLAKKGKNEVIGILSSASPRKVAILCVEMYKMGGLDAVYRELDMFLRR